MCNSLSRTNLHKQENEEQRWTSRQLFDCLYPSDAKFKSDGPACQKEVRGLIREWNRAKDIDSLKQQFYNQHSIRGTRCFLFLKGSFTH